LPTDDSVAFPSVTPIASFSFVRDYDAAPKL
jgi:hypothetical protein